MPLEKHTGPWFETRPALDLLDSPGIIYFAVSLGLVFVAKILKSRVTRYSLRNELTIRNNQAVAISTAGYLTGVFIVARSALMSGAYLAETFWTDICIFASWTLIGIALLLLSAWANKAFLLRRFQSFEELIKHQNTGTGIVIGGTYIGTALIISASITGTTGGGFGIDLLGTLVHLLIGQVAFIVLGALYQRVSGYSIHGEIQRDNPAAALAFSFTLIATAVLIAGQIRRSDSLPALLLWIPISIFVLLGCRWLVDLVVFRNSRLHHEIARDKNWPAALIQGGATVGTAFLLDASFF